jgi:hypothetical protein
MKRFSILCAVLCVGISATPTFAAGLSGGTGTTGAAGGAFGSSATAPGTNSLGTALSSSGHGRRQKGAPLGTGAPAVRRANDRAEQAVHSICRGC